MINVGWIKLVDGENQVLSVMASHVAMIGPHYTEKKFADLKQPSPNKCNIFIGGAFFTVQGSQDLVQALVSQALAQVGSLDSPDKTPVNDCGTMAGKASSKFELLTKNKEEN